MSATQLDHLVVMADTLDQGVAWCQATLGVTPGPGGEHPLFGTHNRLLAIESPAFPRAYLEIIAINPAASCQAPVRWFDMDDAVLQARVRAQGPQLIHWVARVPDVVAARNALAAQGIDRGAVRAASRMTPNGLLEWQITVRADGQRLLEGALPTLIGWGAVHPAADMAAGGVALQRLTLTHPEAPALHAALQALQLQGLASAVQVQPGPAALAAELRTPLGRVTMDAR